MAEKCSFGEQCYRKNREHVKKFHGKDANKAAKTLDGFFKKAEPSTAAAKRPLTPLEPEEDVTAAPEPATKTKKPKLASCTYHRVDASTDEIFKMAKQRSSTKPLDVFAELEGARLVGVFEQLNGDLDGLDEDEIRVRHRATTDLPEMATCLIHNAGRYAIWRDEPNSEDQIIVHVDQKEHFPTIQVVGDRVIHALVHLADSQKKANLEDLLPPKSSVDNLRKEMKAAVSKRNKKKLGKVPNGAGIWVKVTNDIGYREISEEPTRIKQLLVSLGTAADDVLRDRYRTKLMELVTYVQFANDECDFGMGLELGHWLFLANYEAADSLAQKVLSMAYNLLDRDEYGEIVRAQFDTGRRSSDKK